MQITIELPDEYAQRLERDLPNLSRRVLEALVAEAYKAEHFTSSEVGKILGLSRFEVDAFLKQHEAYLHYSIEDFNQDLETLQQLRERQSRQSTELANGFWDDSCF